MKKGSEQQESEENKTNQPERRVSEIRAQLPGESRRMKKGRINSVLFSQIYRKQPEEGEGTQLER